MTKVQQRQSDAACTFPPPAKRWGGSPAKALAKAGGVGGLLPNTPYFRFARKFPPHPRPLPTTHKRARGEGSGEAVHIRAVEIA